MALEDLSELQLLRLLGTLTLAQGLALDVVRGRSVTREEAVQLRNAVVLIRRVLLALDESQDWEAFPPTRDIIRAGDRLVDDALSPESQAAWVALTTPWRPE